MVGTIAAAKASSFLVLQQAIHRKILRALAMQMLYPTLPAGSSNDPLVTLANTFTRYASTQQTAYETGAANTIAATGTTNLLKRQAMNAIAQVLGRSPGSSPASFNAALNETFRTTTDGKVSFTPSRSTVSLYGQSGSSLMAEVSAAGLMGQLSAEQATLYRQASIIAADALRVLEGLHPFTPEADLDRVDALRALVRSEIQAIVDEFGRVDEPRLQRVESYLDQLLGANGHLNQLGERAFLDRYLAAPATLDDEAQIANFELLQNYARLLREIWNNYKPSTQSKAFPLFSERLSRASVLLPVISEGNRNLMAALDSIGFTENERRSSATKFTTLGMGSPQLPDMTVNDLNEWIDRFATLEGPANLADAGQYGLEFVTEQADQLFWVIVPILAFTKTAPTLTLSSMPIVAQAFSHERVAWTMDDLIYQFDALAGLAA